MKDLEAIMTEIIFKNEIIADKPIDYILENYSLSEESILYLVNNGLVTWKQVSIMCKLNEQFIRKYADKLDWKMLNICQELTDEFKKEFSHKIGGNKNDN